MGSTKFTGFETVMSYCVTSLTDRPVASARRATLEFKSTLNLHQIKHTINRKKSVKFGGHVSICAMASRIGSGTAGMFTPGGAWIVPCNKPAAKYEHSHPFFHFYAGDFWPAVMISYYFFYLYFLPYFVCLW